MSKRTITFETAKATFVHRFTLEHVPAWSRKPFGDGTYPAPQYSSDREWYENTRFNGEDPLATSKYCYSSGQTWPLGKALSAPYRR